MGVKNLWDILESCKKTLPLHHLQNKRLCVDLSCWLIQLQNASKCAAAAKEKLYLKSLFHRLRALIALNCTLIFVTDGSIPSIKLSTYRQRLGSVSEVTREERVPELPSLRRNMGSEFSCMIKEAKVLGLALGIPCLDGLEEAEAQCALLNSASLCDGCFSADSDIFLFGARTVYRDIFLGEGGYVVCYDMVDIERKLGFGRNSLISFALLLGSDYSQGVHGFGRETACKIVKSIGDDAILQHIVSEGIAIVRKTKGKKKQGEMLNCDTDKENRYDQKIYERQMSGSDKHFMQVIHAYLKPKCHSAESDAVRRVCTQHAFCRTDLQEICDRFFGWSPDITDQYILPKIAERDLRRFANLRAISSELGVRIPLHKIPVACPLSAILKQRKIQGRECFEVSWKDIDGLQISVVPADLVESACPEKIVEFREKKDEAKKQKRASGSRKSSKVSVSKVDVQLQHMLLNVELQSEALPNSTERESTPEDTYESIDVQFESLLLNVESQSKALLHTTKHLSTQETRVDTFKSVVIDLSSPSPPLRACKLAKKIQDVTNYHLNVIDVAEATMCPKNKSQHVDVIDVYESENDVTPEHERKARELRLFINKIRGDLY